MNKKEIIRQINQLISASGESVTLTASEVQTLKEFNVDPEQFINAAHPCYKYVDKDTDPLHGILKKLDPIRISNIGEDTPFTVIEIDIIKSNSNYDIHSHE